MLRNLNQSDSGKRICGTPKSGVLGSLIPATGDNGPGYTYNDLTLPADNSKEICGRITRWPTLGSLFAYEDTSFTYDGLTDSFDYQLVVDGVDVGSPVTVLLAVGTVTHDASGALASGPASLTGVALRVRVHASSGALVADFAQIVGSAARSATLSHDATGNLVSSNATLTGAASGSPTLTLTPADINAIVNAVITALQATTIPVDTKKMNGATVLGTGIESDKWRGNV